MLSLLPSPLSFNLFLLAFLLQPVFGWSISQLSGAKLCLRIRSLDSVPESL